MDISNSNGLIGKYSNKDVYVVTREEYDGTSYYQDNVYYVIKDFPTVEGYPTLVRNNNIVGHCTNSGAIKIYNIQIPYLRLDSNKGKDKSRSASADSKKEYTYTMKDNDDAKQHHKEEYLNIEALAQKASELIKQGLAIGNKLLKEEQERAQVLCCATHNK